MTDALDGATASVAEVGAEECVRIQVQLAQTGAAMEKWRRTTAALDGATAADAEECAEECMEEQVQVARIGAATWDGVARWVPWTAPRRQTPRRARRSACRCYIGTCSCPLGECWPLGWANPAAVRWRCRGMRRVARIALSSLMTRATSSCRYARLALVCAWAPTAACRCMVLELVSVASNLGVQL